MNANQPYFLGIDSGGTYIKAGIYDKYGSEQTIVRQTTSLINPCPGWVERDMEMFWHDTAKVVSLALEKAAIPVSAIRGVGISAQGKGLYLLDENRKAVGNGILSADQRAMDIVRAWQREGVPARLYPTTRQTLWTGHPATLLRWYKENKPGDYSRARHVLMTHDYLRFRLTGEIACERTNISESNLYNMATEAYDPALFGLLGIAEAEKMMPPIVGSAETAGRITREAADKTGLPEGLPVVGGLFDVVSVSLCSGLVDAERINTVMGTWSIATGLADRVANHPEYAFVYGKHAEPGRYIVHDASPTSAANYEWFRRVFTDSHMDYASANQAVAQLPKAESGLFFLPFVTGSNAGLGMKGGFYGLCSAYSPAHLVQAIFEGTVFSLNVHLKRLRMMFSSAKALRMAGGAARSRPWMEILADLSGLPVEIPQVEEMGCLGAALAAAVGTGEFGNFFTAVNSLRTPMAKIDPDPSMHDAYLAKEARYQKLVDVMREFQDKNP